MYMYIIGLSIVKHSICVLLGEHIQVMVQYTMAAADNDLEHLLLSLPPIFSIDLERLKMASTICGPLH